MKIVFIFLLSLCNCCISLTVIAQNPSEVSTIKGTFELDSTLWESNAYLSHITSFNDMYTISKDMIIAETTIDDHGHFEFPTNYFPKEAQ